MVLHMSRTIVNELSLPGMLLSYLGSEDWAAEHCSSSWTKIPT